MLDRILEIESFSEVQAASVRAYVTYHIWDTTLDAQSMYRCVLRGLTYAHTNGSEHIHTHTYRGLLYECLCACIHGVNMRRCIRFSFTSRLHTYMHKHIHVHTYTQYPQMHLSEPCKMPLYVCMCMCIHMGAARVMQQQIFLYVFCYRVCVCAQYGCFSIVLLHLIQVFVCVCALGMCVYICAVWVLTHCVVECI